MALTQSQVRVAGTGKVLVAPEGTAMPTDLDDLLTPPGLWKELGYVTTDGVTFTISRESTDLSAWQGDKVRVLTTAEPMTVEFALMETSPDVLAAALGGGTVDDDGTIATFTPPIPGTNTPRALIIEFTDGVVPGSDPAVPLSYRYCIPKAQIEGDVSWQLLRSDSVNYPLTFGVLDATPKYTVITNDPAFIAAGGALLAAPASVPEGEDEPEPEYADA